MQGVHTYLLWTSVKMHSLINLTRERNNVRNNVHPAHRAGLGNRLFTLGNLLRYMKNTAPNVDLAIDWTTHDNVW